MPITKLAQVDTRGRVKFHTITLTNNTVLKTHGLVGGVVTVVPPDVYAAINVGKANYKTPEVVAQEAYAKFIKDKTRDGYKVVTDWDEATVEVVDPDAIFTTLPTQLCMSKPETEITPEKYDKLRARGRVRLQVKENGLCHLAFVSDAVNALTTRRMFDHTPKYRDILAAIKGCFPPKTMVVVELVVEDPTLSHMQRFTLMSSISKSDTKNGDEITDPTLPKTTARRAEHKVVAVVLAVPIYDGKLCLKLSQETWDAHRARVNHPLLRLPTELPLTMTHAEVIQYAKDHGIEGAAFWDMDAEMLLTLTGKPKRRAAYKIKPVYEIDVLAVGWEPEKNKNNGRIGALKIHERGTDENGSPCWIDRGTVGSGLKDVDQDPADWTFPCVVTIEFSERHEDTDNFQFARFAGKHPDKTPEEL